MHDREEVGRITLTKNLLWILLRPLSPSSQLKNEYRQYSKIIEKCMSQFRALLYLACKGDIMTPTADSVEWKLETMVANTTTDA